MAPLGIVVGDVAADFELGSGQNGTTTAVEQRGLEAALNRFGVGVAVAIASPAHALLRMIASQ